MVWAVNRTRGVKRNFSEGLWARLSGLKNNEWEEVGEQMEIDGVDGKVKEVKKKEDGLKDLYKGRMKRGGRV